MRIIDVASCKDCKYFTGSFYAACAGETAQIIYSNEIVNGSCYHPVQLEDTIKPRPISQKWTLFENNFPTWCELEEKEV